MESSIAVTRGAYTISTDKQLLDLAVIHRYLSEESYWAKRIPVDVVKRSVEHSLCFGIYTGAQQVGFARLVTDKATFAYLADVFVLPAHRGRGLSKWLMNVIQSHPEVQGLRRWMLMTRDAQRLYTQFGWTELEEEHRPRCMQRVFKDVYTGK